MLLAILCGALFALTGLGPAARAVAIVAVIAAYVPIAGAGPSIQRAGVMGVAGILAGLVGRGADRAYLPLLAAVVTLTLNPLAAGEVGWQLSFAAVLGIALWAAPIRDLALARLGPGPAGGPVGRVARPLAEGAGLTVSATVATAPLMALHFETVSLASLPANLLALPAVAPVMWLGMLASILGQLPLIPAEPLGVVLGPLLGYIEAVAELLAGPGWATLALPAPHPVAVAGIYLGLVGGAAAALAALRRRRRLTLGPRARVALAVLAVAAGLLGLGGSGSGAPGAVEPGRLRISALDVGQGDALLLQPAETGAVLVDTGPPGAGLTASLDRLGVRRLAAVFVTHDQRDHSGALAELLDSTEVDRLLLGRPAPVPAGLAREAGAEVERVAAGAALELGRLRLQVLAPPPAAAGPPADPNADSLVLAARYGGYSALLTGDAESEARRLDPGPFDVLKVAHHGSADAGLEALLDRSAPRVALISVGDPNPYGHPAPETLAALAARSICLLRTDRDGDVWAELGADGLRVGSSGGQEPEGCRH
jgi:competence protein ComEC